MAKKNKHEATETTSESTTSAEEVIDFSRYLPAGYDAADLRKVGGLIPLVPAPLAHELGIIVAGWVIDIVAMPERPSLKIKGEKEAWDTVLVELTAPCKGQSGDDLVDMMPGDHAMIPVGGSLKNNAGLLRAAKNPKEIYIGIFQVKGTRDVGKPSEMFEYEVHLHPRSRERVGVELLNSATGGTQLPPPAAPSNGALPATSEA